MKGWQGEKNALFPVFSLFSYLSVLLLHTITNNVNRRLSEVCSEKTRYFSIHEDIIGCGSKYPDI